MVLADLLLLKRLKMKPTTSAGTPSKQGSIGQISKFIWVAREEQKGSHSRENLLLGNSKPLMEKSTYCLMQAYPWSQNISPNRVPQIWITPPTVLGKKVSNRPRFVIKLMIIYSLTRRNQPILTLAEISTRSRIIIVLLFREWSGWINRGTPSAKAPRCSSAASPEAREHAHVIKPPWYKIPTFTGWNTKEDPRAVGKVYRILIYKGARGQGKQNHYHYFHRLWRSELNIEGSVLKGRHAGGMQYNPACFFWFPPLTSVRRFCWDCVICNKLKPVRTVKWFSY